MLPLGVLAALAFVFSPSPSAHAATYGAGEVLLIDRPSGFGDIPGGPRGGTLETVGASMATGDDHVLFASTADAMTPEDDDALVSWFVRTRSTGALRFVGPGTSSAFNAGVADISKDGRWACFASLMPLVPGDTDRRIDVYLADLAGAQPVYTRITEAASAGLSNGDACALSADGSTIAYTSLAREDAVVDSDDVQDVYVRPVPGPGTPQLASRATGAGGSNFKEPAFQPDLDADGSVVSFNTVAPMDAGDTNAASDVYVRDRAGDVTEIVSTADNTAATEGNSGSSYSALSADGRFVAFASSATNFVPVTPSFAHVFRKDRTTDDTIVVSREPDGDVLSQSSTAPKISADGGSVAFWSLAALLPADTDGQNDAYVWRNLDAATPELKLVSKPGGEAGGVAIGDVTAAGDRVVFASVPSLHPDTEGIMGLYERVLATDAVTHLSAPLGHAGGALFGPQRTGEMDAGSQAMSADGRIVVFESDAQYLPGAVPLREQVYARDVLTGETMLVSRGAGAGGAPANLSAFDAAVSPDGSKVAFTTAAANLGGDASDIAKVYVRDLSDGSLVLASRAANGDPLNGTSLGPVLSHDGRFVAFTTGATNAGNGDADALTDVHRRDLVTGELTLISRVDGAAGAKATGGDGSFQPAIDGSGNRVAFTSSATNLHGSREVYLRDVAAGSTTLISRADGADGARDTSPNNVQDLSADGTRVAFLSSGGLEGLGASQTGVLVRDVGSSQTMLGSAPDAGLAVPAGGTFRGGLSDNGRFVWFSGNGAGWIAEEHPWSTQLTYRHDLQTGDTVLLARGPGASGALPRFGSSSSAALSGDGGCAAFDSHGIGEVVTSGASPDFEHVYYRVLEGTCPRPAPEPKPEPSPDPTPQPTASPTATPTPRPPAPKPAPVQPAKLADLLQAPGTKKCVSRRRLRTKLKAAVRAKVSKVTVQIKGKKPLTVRGSKLRAPIDLRGLPKGKFTVTITITLKDGSIVKEKRTYKTCAPKKRKR